MGIAFHLVPLHPEACSVSAENAVSSVFKVAVGVICNFFYYFIGIVTGIIAFEHAAKLSLALCIARNGGVIISHFGNGRTALDDCIFTLIFGGGKFRSHLLQVI